MSVLPNVIIIFLGLFSLAFAVFGLMTTEPPFGQLGTVAALGGFVAAVLITLRSIAYS